jgi:DeoR/GlpR family transcriptional regulator of sugar metabolism
VSIHQNHRSRGSQVVRQWHVLQLLAAGRRTPESLAVELGVTSRTIRRDLEMLSQAWFPVRSYGGWWCLDNCQPFGFPLADRQQRTRPAPDSAMAQREIRELRGWLELPYAGGAR